VFDEDPAPPEKRHSPPPNFGQCLLWPNGWMDEDATWYGSRPRPRPYCVRRGPRSSPQKGVQQPPLFGPCLLWPRSPISATAELLLPNILLKKIPVMGKTCFALDTTGQFLNCPGKSWTVDDRPVYIPMVTPLLAMDYVKPSSSSSSVYAEKTFSRSPTTTFAYDNTTTTTTEGQRRR